MTVSWTTQISEDKWKRVRRELGTNGFALPFINGAVQNRKTGYTLRSSYNPDTSCLKLWVTYPGSMDVVMVNDFLDSIFESEGILQLVQ